MCVDSVPADGLQNDFSLSSHFGVCWWVQNMVLVPPSGLDLDPRVDATLLGHACNMVNRRG